MVVHNNAGSQMVPRHDTVGRRGFLDSTRFPGARTLSQRWWVLLTIFNYGGR